ncbi:hypothetical protein SAMN05660380_00050 [Xylella fastidiosa]|jgi:hypothetical protein|nr:hypothetical protein SAMN05660380_00050 [Xylella fastidiosa]
MFAVIELLRLNFIVHQWGMGQAKRRYYCDNPTTCIEFYVYYPCL